MTKHWTALITASLATLLIAFATVPFARADIFEWAYINSDVGIGPSATLCPDGAGVNVGPGANLANLNLTSAYLAAANLSGANFTQANLTQATFNSSTPAATLTGANFSQANLTNADFSGYVGFDPNDPGEYFYLGADLTGASLVQANLTGANFYTATLTNADLSHTKLNANFYGATLTGANLTGADVRGAYFNLAHVGHPYSTYLGGITLAQLYTTASYHAHDLTGIGLPRNDLTGVNLAGQNLTNARFSGAKLTGADLTGADVRNANFNREFLSYIGYAGGLTLAQLYSTASYLMHDLNGIGLAKNDLTGGNFIGQNFTNASFQSATLTDANLTGAEVRGANFSRLDDYGSVYGSGITVAQLYSTASYQAHGLTGIGLAGNNLADVSLAGQNLTNADLTYATLTNANLSQANLTGAAVRGTNFGNSITAAQLYSTASYQTHDMTGIGLSDNNFTGANLASQNLSNANFSGATLIGSNLANADFSADYYYPAANLTGANLSLANLTNANFSGFEYYDDYGDYIVPGANLTNANLSGADARGANFQYAALTGANTSNLIESNGRIAGLHLSAGASLIVRDYDGNPAGDLTTGPLAIVVDQHLAMDATGALRLVFDADAWDSTISFAPGIPVALGGTLELTFAPGVSVATQNGRTIDLFDWTGVTPTGAFTLESPYTWNLSNLYITGEVTLPAATSLPGDFNGDGSVNAADYVVWRNGGINGHQGYADWRAHFGTSLGTGSGLAIASARPLSAAVPEPTALISIIMTAVVGSLIRAVTHTKSRQPFDARHAH